MLSYEYIEDIAMDKAAIKQFAIWARNKLIADTRYRAGLLGITENGIADPMPQSTDETEFYKIGTTKPYVLRGSAVKQRKELVDVLRRKERDADYITAYNSIIEEVAYTWFNRLIAIRFMEVNEYLPSHIRVLSSENGRLEPDLLVHPFDADLDLTNEEKATIIQLRQDDRIDELFQMLFIKQCNALNDILPGLFEKTGDYTELLINLSVIDHDGVIYHLVHDIDEADWTEQVQIIGWLYQYYISERHDEIINIYKGTIKKDDIPAATQLFTTDWVVRYMVDNSLGRYWIERHPESSLINKLEYFVKPKNGEIQFIKESLAPQELTFFDPCMGSGHILLYAFDILMHVYRECGYTDRDAAQEIVEHNLFGLDIDDRCSQLAYFAVMMKARSYDRRFLSRGITPHIHAIKESSAIDTFTDISYLPDRQENQVGIYLVETFKYAKEIGSLQLVEHYDYGKYQQYLDDCEMQASSDLNGLLWASTDKPLLVQLAEQAKILTNKYKVVCTNPPYLNKLEGHLKDYILEEYKPYSGDLFSTFMYHNFSFCVNNGYSAFMTPFVWMFIKTYENLREDIISFKHIVTLIQMEYSAFEDATVPICTFVLKNGRDNSPSLCFRLSDFKGGMEVQKEKVLEALSNPNCGYFYEIQQDNFTKIPGSPIAYWASNTMVEIFNNPLLSEIASPKVGLQTGENNKFVRIWNEVSYFNICFDAIDREVAWQSKMKWFPYNKGGDFRKWYGNNDYVVNWYNDGYDIRHFVDNKGNQRSYIRNSETYFHESITWSKISSGNIAFRYKPFGHIYDVAGTSIFCDHETLLYLAGFCNSNVALAIANILSPTINYEVGRISNFPIIIEDIEKYQIISIVDQTINLSRTDWDSFETSWDFQRHPLVRSVSTIADAFAKWEIESFDRFYQLKANEEELNRIFIDIYGLQDELTLEEEDKDVSVRKADLGRDIRSLLSYAVGCMFGRYSLDVDGLAYAGGDWDSSKYITYQPDITGIIPITDEEYFGDDIVGYLCKWLKAVYGSDTLEENLDFIAQALGGKGDSSREVIRNYFLNDFFKDHCKIYQKRPIYWLFDSGKQNGFKALIYLHRYTPDTIGNLRVDYLHRMQRIYESEISRMQDLIDHSSSPRESARATKRKEKLQKQQKECRDYDEMVTHLALSHIDLDLDDGVKVNYEKVQTANDGKMYPILAKIG